MVAGGASSAGPVTTSTSIVLSSTAPSAKCFGAIFERVLALVVGGSLVLSFLLWVPVLSIFQGRPRPRFTVFAPIEGILNEDEEERR